MINHTVTDILNSAQTARYCRMASLLYIPYSGFILNICESLEVLPEQIFAMLILRGVAAFNQQELNFVSIVRLVNFAKINSSQNNPAI